LRTTRQLLRHSHPRRQRPNHPPAGEPRHRDRQEEDRGRKFRDRVRGFGPLGGPHHQRGQVPVSGSPMRTNSAGR
jgi:hypothetical protein